MNLIKEKNLPNSSSLFLQLFIRRIIFLTSLIVFAFSQARSQFPAHLVRTWKYIRIENSRGEAVKSIGENDNMILHADSTVRTFHYSLELEKIHSEGTWNLVDSILQFTYPALRGADQLPLVRKFKILLLEKNILHMQEQTAGNSTGLIFKYISATQ